MTISHRRSSFGDTMATYQDYYATLGVDELERKF